MSISKTHNYRFRQRGVSMVELMIAMLLGLFLMAGVLQLFSSNKQTFGNMEGISEIQDGARAGIERMKSRLRMAGYMGCSNASALAPNNLTIGGVSDVGFGPDVMIQGTDNDTTDPNIVDGTDSVTVVFATAANTELNANMTSQTSDIVITSNPNNFQELDALIISDCENADIFGISKLDLSTGPPFTIKHGTTHLPSGDAVNSADTLSKPYLANNSLIMSLSNATYTVENTPRFDDAGNPVTALFETRGGTSTEIVTGVEDMQIVYGVDTDPSPDGQANGYQSAPAPGSALWARVVSVRIALLIATEREIGRDVRPYNFLTDTAGIAGAGQAGDRHMRRSFTTTIGLRNRSS